MAALPRDDEDDYTPDAIEKRRAFIEHRTGVKLNHILQRSFDPHLAKGNCENFVGVAQVPLGPSRIRGESANGDFLVPLATSEGKLVASYNRGMKVLNLCAGVEVTVIADAMQRAPVFVFRNARAARLRQFGERRHAADSRRCGSHFVSCQAALHRVLSGQ